MRNGILIMTVFVAAALTPAWAEEEKANGGDFITETMSAVKDKLGKVGSSEEAIFYENAKGIEE